MFWKGISLDDSTMLKSTAAPKKDRKIKSTPVEQTAGDLAILLTFHSEFNIPQGVFKCRPASELITLDACRLRSEICLISPSPACGHNMRKVK